MRAERFYPSALHNYNVCVPKSSLWGCYHARIKRFNVISNLHIKSFETAKGRERIDLGSGTNRLKLGNETYRVGYETSVIPTYSWLWMLFSF